MLFENESTRFVERLERDGSYSMLQLLLSVSFANGEGHCSPPAFPPQVHDHPLRRRADAHALRRGVLRAGLPPHLSSIGVKQGFRCHAFGDKNDYVREKCGLITLALRIR